MKIALKEFHNYAKQNTEEPSLDDVVNVTADFWTKYDAGRETGLNSAISLLERRKIIQNYLMMVRGQ